MKKSESDKKNSEAGPATTQPAPAKVPVVAELTPAQLEEIKTRAAKADEHWDRLLRTAADLDNFKKRAARERIEAAQSANVALLLKLLPVLDHFEMAQATTQAAEVPQSGIASLQAGIAMIQQQLKEIGRAHV
jgi:molecular chaperone GrpE